MGGRPRHETQRGGVGLGLQIWDHNFPHEPALASSIILHVPSFERSSQRQACWKCLPQYAIRQPLVFVGCRTIQLFFLRGSSFVKAQVCLLTSSFYFPQNTPNLLFDLLRFPCQVL